MQLTAFQRRNGELYLLDGLAPGAVSGGFVETGEYLIRIPSPGCRLFVDDAPLETDQQSRHWCWSPGFYAGEVLAELEHPGFREPFRYRLDVSPSPNKTGREQYFDYIREIADYAPELLIGNEPARYGLGGRSSSRTAAWIRYARLRCFIDDYLLALKAVCERPLFRQHYYRRRVPAHLARRVDRATVSSLRNKPQLFAALAGKEMTARAVGLPDDRLDVPFNEPTFDHPANRLLAEQLGGVLRLVAALIRDFQNPGAESGETETDIYPRLARKIQYLNRVQRELLRLTRAEPFASVSGKAAGIAGINAVTASPAYARSHRLGVRVLREGLSELAEDEQHYLAPTWQVYEAWCFVALAKQLEKRLPDFEWHLDTAPASADMILTGSKGAQRLRLYSQLVCPSLENKNRYGYTSISRERRPDIVFESSNGPSQRFICLDAKYRTSRSGVLDAMASAHIYRDSVKCGGVGPEFSLLLLPHCRETAQLSISQYIDRTGVGCVTLASMKDAVKTIHGFCLPAIGQ